MDISVDWNTQTFDRVGFDLTEESMDSICQSHSLSMATTLIPSRQTFWKAFQSCRMFNSEMETCDSQSADRAVRSSLNQPGRERLCERKAGQYSHWCGFTDERSEGSWTDVNTGAALARPDPLWYNNKPNGRQLENCLVAYVTFSDSPGQNVTTWNDAQCSYTFCYLCRSIQGSK